MVPHFYQQKRIRNQIVRPSSFAWQESTELYLWIKDRNLHRKAKAQITVLRNMTKRFKQYYTWLERISAAFLIRTHSVDPTKQNGVIRNAALDPQTPFVLYKRS